MSISIWYKNGEYHWESMNIKLNYIDHPVGSRFLYRDCSGYLQDGTIREWANSGQYLNFSGAWIKVEDTQYFTFIEQLADDTFWQDKT